MRGKIYLGVIVAMLIASVTTISAQQNMKESLQQWYKQTFQQKSAEHSEELANQITTLETDILILLEHPSQEIDSDVLDFLDTAKANSEEEIISHQEKYLNQLETTKQNLLEDVDDYDEEFLEEEREKIDDDMEAIVTDLLDDILSQSK